MVDVCEEGVRAPTPQNLDCLYIKAIDAQSCGPTCQEGVAGD